MKLISILILVIIVLFLFKLNKKQLNNPKCGCKNCSCGDCKCGAIEGFRRTPVRHLRRSGRRIAHPILPAHKKFFPDNKQVLGLDFNEVFKNRLFECQTKCADFKDRKCYKMVNGGNVAFACLTEDMKNRYNKCSKNGGSTITITNCMSSDGTKFYYPPIFY